MAGYTQESNRPGKRIVSNARCIYGPITARWIPAPISTGFWQVARPGSTETKIVTAWHAAVLGGFGSRFLHFRLGRPPDFDRERGVLVQF